MKKTNFILLTISVLLYQACDYVQMNDEKSNLEIIGKNIGAKAIKMVMVNEINHISGDTTSFIELTFQNSSQSNNDDTHKSKIASYSAIQAFLRFNPKIWNGKDGVSIVFKNETTNQENKYYYKLNELEDIVKIMKNFDRFIESLETAKIASQEQKIEALRTEDSLKIASFFDNKLFAVDSSFMNLLFQVYKSLDMDLNKTDRQYYYQTLTISDTIGSKITDSYLYQLKLTYFLPFSENISRMECFVNKSNLDKIIAIRMNTEEE